VPLEVSVPGQRSARLEARTLGGDLGEELSRFATLSDLHLGATAFDFFQRMKESGVRAEDAHPVRCARAAIGDALAWGAQRIVVKGDVTNTSHTHTWALAADVLGGLPVPVDMIPGNHDRNQRATVDAFAEARRHGLALHSDVSTVDLEGLRLVFVDSTVAGIDIGVWRPHRHEMLDAVAEARQPAMIVVHHQPMASTIPMHLPRGIPAVVANPILRRMRAANPRIVGTSGHTHRHRRRTVAGVPWFESGSTKDFPGTWTGYVVHERGIRQVTRRITSPDCISWTERTRRAAAGAWQHWSPGSLADRCFELPW
jgi:3',5'-cyclic AMP phosphodiesterase CpdA